MSIFGGQLREPTKLATQDFQTDMGDYLSAVVGDAAASSPVLESNASADLDAARYGERMISDYAADRAGGGTDLSARYEPATPVIDSATAGQRIKDAGLKGRLSWADGMRDGELSILIDRKRAEIARADARARAPSSYAWVGVPLEITAGVLDPINVGLSFVPVVGETRYAAMLARAGTGAAERAAVRAGVGLAEGAVGSVLAELPVAAAKLREQADYTMADALLNVAFGTALGGGLHVGAGFAGDWLGRRAAAALERDRRAAADVPHETLAAPVVAAEPPVDLRGAYLDTLDERTRAALEASRPQNAVEARARAVENLTPEIRAQVLAEAGRRAEPRAVEGLRAERADLANQLATVDGSARELARAFNEIPGVTRKKAESMAARATTERRADIEARLGRIDTLIADNKAGATAEAELGQLARGEIPARFEPAVLAEADRLTNAPLKRPLGDAVRQGLTAQSIAMRADPLTREAALRTAVGHAMDGRLVNVEPLFRSDQRTGLQAPTAESVRAAGQRQGEPASSRSADVAAAADASKSEKLPADPAAIQRTIAEQGSKAVAELAIVSRGVAAGRGDLLDAPNFGLKEPPRTIHDADPILTSTHTINTPEREALRAEIVADTLKDADPVDGRKPVAYLMGGGGASGKGTILARLRAAGMVPERAVTIDPDAIKAKLPEYATIQARGDSRGSTVVHEESKLIAKRALEEAQAQKFDIVLDRTLGDPQKGLAELQALKAAGYEVRLYGVTVDPVSAIERAAGRAERTGRYVPPADLLRAHKGFASAFERYAEIADHAALFDNEVPAGAAARVIATAEAGKIDIADTAMYNVFRERSRINEHATTRREAAGLVADDGGKSQGARQANDGAAGTNRARPNGEAQGANADRLSDQRLTRQLEADTAELIAALPPELRAELAEFDTLIADAGAYSRAARAAARCLLRT